MKICSSLTRLATITAMLLGSAAATAQDEADAQEGPSVFPVEIYVCNYHDGKGGAELAAWSAKWAAWADGGLAPYSAWTLTPFYFGGDQDFDFIWLGASPNAVAMGQAQDKWLAEGGSLAAEMDAIAHCSAHGNYATMNFKEPPDDESPNVVLNFSDCSAEEGKTFDDVYPALQAWSEYRSSHGSTAGMWVMWPAFGGGDADFDFKWVNSYRNYEALGQDYDQYSAEGWKKAEELFTGLLDCDEARSYVAVRRYDGIPDED